MLVLVAACGPSAEKTEFIPPDGHWWIAASAAARDGFDIGHDECDSSMLRHPVPWISRLAFEDAVTSYYHQNSRDLGVSVVAVMAMLDARWRQSKAHRFVTISPANAYDSDMWWPPSPDTRDGIIRGFLACQVAEQGFHPSVPVEMLIRRTSAWYGIDPNKEGVVNPKTEHDKLGPVILRAEQQGP